MKKVKPAGLVFGSICLVLFTAKKGSQAKIPKDNEDYAGNHEAPDHEGGIPLHNLLVGYPKDVYQFGQTYYGVGDGSDSAEWRKIYEYKNHPNKPVFIYRSIASDVAPYYQRINNGDWVGLTKEYAVLNGLNRYGNADNFVIVKSRVRAGELFTDGNSVREWGVSLKVNRAIISSVMNRKFYEYLLR